MNELLKNSVFFGVFLSLAAYEAGVFVKKKWKLAIFNPLLVAIVLVLACLLLFRINYETYEYGAKYISFFLTPATVCLAIPLYEQWEVLKKHARAVFIGITSGVLASLFSIYLFARLFGLSHEQYVTLLPKSITTAIGMDVSKELGGIVTITVAVIVLTGVLGNVIAEHVCRLLRIQEPIAKGIAIGSASHAIGTAKALEIGEVEGAMSSLSIVIAGLLTVFGANVFSILM